MSVEPGGGALLLLTRTLEGGGLNPYPGGGALTRTLGRGGLISDPHPRGGGPY